MSPWVAAARPKTLVAGLIPVMLGSAYAFNQGSFRFWIFLCALFGALAIQIGTNYVNDASDFEKGADTKDRLGPPRMAASGLLSPRALYRGAGVCFLAALLFGAYLVKEAGPWMLVVGLMSIFFGVIYTAGPFPLAYLGLGDLFVLIFFGLVAVLGTIFAHLGPINGIGVFTQPSALYLALATGFHGMGLIAVNNLRDIPTDILAGKKTFAVRLGDKTSRFYFAFLEFLPYFCWMPISSQIPGTFAFLPYFSLPLATLNAFVCFRIRERKEFNGLLARSAALQLLFGLLASLSLVLSR
jgi:1,4-dihydroxy-2-naphthoate octaprenyltransferase